MSSVAEAGGQDRIVPMRLQKFLARAGAASRRGSENLMTAGRVAVNGIVVTELGSKVDPLVDEVAVDGVVVRLADGPVTLMLHKPAGVVTTMSDPQERPTVAGLVPVRQYPGLFPIGRLDRDTTGLLLFSTDGELGHALLRPSGHVTKFYTALVAGVPTPGQLAHLREGIELDDGLTLPAEVELLEGDRAQRALAALDVPPVVPPCASRQYARACSARAKERSVVRIGLHEGRKRQVRRMLDAIGHPVLALHRDTFGPLQLGDLPRGEWRQLDAGEVAALGQAPGRS
ncbi:MAG: pseudouridine synthase [Gordonibacter sp.]|uniref:pseudouridine synthase n=1 Tax=Gordonibacter sp. TaxID=1968902 RepID=UPI0032207DB2